MSKIGIVNILKSLTLGKKNWSEIIPFLAYPKDIRKVIYTTNAIESANSQIKKIIKNNRIFTDRYIFSF